MWACTAIQKFQQKNTHDPFPSCLPFFPPVLTGSSPAKVPDQPSKILLWVRSRGIEDMPGVPGPEVGIVGLQWLFKHMHKSWMKHAWIWARVSPLIFLATSHALWSVVQCLTISQGSLKWWAYTVKSHCFWTLKVCLCMHNAPLNCFAEAFAREKRKKLEEILTQLHLFV